ncbi:MAG: general secretion pathway protein GspK [Oligoflexales bacterium]|nr:general secretion pathway protein GspK [Oligoflexales bacterium]
MIKIKLRMPKTYLGFPISEDDGKNTDQNKSPSARSRGVAMIIAIMLTAMMLIFSVDMVINSTVNLQLSSSNRDNVKGEYLAKSGINLAIFLIIANWGIDLYQYQMMQKVPNDGPGSIWSTLNGIPIGGSTSQLIESVQENFNLSKVNDSDALKMLTLFDGEFVIDIEDETSRLNLNTLGKGRALEALAMLQALMSCPPEKEYLLRKKLQPKELAANIKDWIHPSAKPDPTSSFSSKDDPYIKKNPRYRAKSAPMDSLDELLMVEGWDSDLHKIFSPFLTVYPVPKTTDTGDIVPQVNVNSAAREMLSCLLPEGNLQCAEKSAKEMTPCKDETREPITGSEGVSKFVSEVFCTNDNKMKKWFTYRTDTFRIKSTAEVGNQEKVIEAVIQRQLPDEIEEKEGVQGSYKILYWKMI